MRDANIAIGELGQLLGPRTEGTSLIREIAGDDRYFTNFQCVTLGPCCPDDTSVPISDKDLAKLIPHINAYSKFQTLYLYNTNVTDDGLAQLARIENLEYLNVTSPRITDAGINNLRSVSTLRKVVVACDAVTDAALLDLQSLLPDLEVKRERSRFRRTTL